jgi:hypothetical protein
MDLADEPGMTADEQLGSPGWTFEEGVLIGLLLGLAVLAVRGRRSRRRTDRDPAS